MGESGKGMLPRFRQDFSFRKPPAADAQDSVILNQRRDIKLGHGFPD